jgi:hypothetical protein
MKNIPKKYHPQVRKLIKKARDSERERIRLAFVEECEKNNKRHGGSFVTYSFENTELKKEL